MAPDRPRCHNNLQKYQSQHHQAIIELHNYTGGLSVSIYSEPNLKAKGFETNCRQVIII